MLYTFICKLCAEFCLVFCFHLQRKDFDIEMSGSFLTCGMNAPNVLVFSRIGELWGICWNKDRHKRWCCFNLWKKQTITFHFPVLYRITNFQNLPDFPGIPEFVNQQSLSHHVIGDVEAQGAGLVVHKAGGVGGEGGHANVKHVLVLAGEEEGCGGEGGLHVVADVVELTLYGRKDVLILGCHVEGRQRWCSGEVTCRLCCVMSLALISSTHLYECVVYMDISCLITNYLMGWI